VPPLRRRRFRKSLLKNASPCRDAAPTAAAKAVLNAAEQLAQMRGYNGFSYADVAAQLGLTKASLHYHFPSKADLGRALIERYRAAFDFALSAIDQQAPDPGDYASMPGSTSQSSIMSGCVCAECWQPSTRPFLPQCNRD
jgi:hypothetical protein